MWTEIGDNELDDLAAQLAYWAILALFPFLMFLLTVLGYLPLQGVADSVMTTLYRFLPAQAHDTVAKVVNEVVGKQRGGLLLVTLLGALWSASGGVSGLVTALNRCYHVRETRPYWRRKAMAIGVTILAALSILVASAGLIIGPDFLHWLWGRIGLGGAFDQIWKWLRWPTVALAMMLMLANVYYFLPNVPRRRWRFITPGAVVAVALWIGASLGFRFYLTHFDSYAKLYGALGTVIVLITWIYLSCLVVIFGGQVNAVLDRQVAEPRRAPVPTDGLPAM